MGSYLFRWPHPEASEVFVTGTFDDWGKTEKLDKVGDTFEKEVQLQDASQKIYYKFVVDGDWTIDRTAPQEDDGHSNINNILKPEEIKQNDSSAAKATAGGAVGGATAGGLGAALLSSVHPKSTTTKLAGDVPLENSRAAPKGDDSANTATPRPAATTTDNSSPPGAFPETPSQESDAFAVNPIPASSGSGNPISLPPGEKLPDHETVTGNNIESRVTTSKEDYENAGSSAGAQEQSFRVDPIPPSAGIGNPDPAGERNNLQPSSLDSKVTTSKDDYEKAGSAPMPVGLSSDGAAERDDLALPKQTKDMIPESSLPMSEPATEAANSGPQIQSSGPGTTTAALAGQVPLEPKSKTAANVNAADSGPQIQSSGPDTTTAALAGQVPLESKSKAAAAALEDEAPSATVTGPAPDVPEVVKESLSQARESPEAASSAIAVDEKKEVEGELLKAVKSTDAAGEPAPTTAAATSAVAPAATATDPKTLEHQPDSDAGPDKQPPSPREISPVDRDARAAAPPASSTQSTTEVGDAKASTNSTPHKTTTPQSSAASSPATADGARDSKKKKRMSFFGKLKEKMKG